MSLRNVSKDCQHSVANEHFAVFICILAARIESWETRDFGPNVVVFLVRVFFCFRDIKV